MHFFDKVFGDRGRLFSEKFGCPYKLCPSNTPEDGSKPASMKFIQKISPRVYQYRCRHCGCLLNKCDDGPLVPIDMHAQNLNPRFIGHNNSPSFEFRGY